MWVLYKAAHELYQFEVVGGGKLYNRYVSDFLNSHTYTDRVDAAGMNEHKKNFHIMEELLTAREDLVQKYFMKEKFCDSDYLSMHQEFNTTQRPSIPETYRTSGLLSNVFISKPNFQCCFNSVQINLITHSINEAHLFSIEVFEKEANDLFFCCLKHPLKSACNRRVAFFLMRCVNTNLSQRGGNML